MVSPFSCWEQAAKLEFLPLANGMDSHTQQESSPSRGPTVVEAGVPALNAMIGTQSYEADH